MDCVKHSGSMTGTMSFLKLSYPYLEEELKRGNPEDSLMMTVLHQCSFTNYTILNAIAGRLCLPEAVRVLEVFEKVQKEVYGDVPVKIVTDRIKQELAKLQLTILVPSRPKVLSVEFNWPSAHSCLLTEYRLVMERLFNPLDCHLHLLHVSDCHEFFFYLPTMLNKSMELVVEDSIPELAANHVLRVVVNQKIVFDSLVSLLMYTYNNLFLQQVTSMCMYFVQYCV